MSQRPVLSLPLSALYPLIKEALEAGGEVYIGIRGNSMLPFLYDGRDQAVFARLGDRRIRRGDILFYQRANGQFVMHRVYSIAQDGSINMVGDAQWTVEKGILPEQLRAFVPRVVRKGKEISCMSGFVHWLMTAYLLRIRFPRLFRMIFRILRFWAGIGHRLRRNMYNTIE